MSAMNETRSAIREFIIETFLFGQAGNLEDASSFLDAGIVDSTGVLQLVAFLEETFSIQVADAELTPENLDSVEAVMRFVERKRSDIPA
jgi:acyl carrier protein